VTMCLVDRRLVNLVHCKLEPVRVSEIPRIFTMNHKKLSLIQIVRLGEDKSDFNEVSIICISCESFLFRTCGFPRNPVISE